MSFNLQSFSRLSSSANNDVVTLQDGTLTGAPCIYSYISPNTIATISAANYFATECNVLNIGDLIYVVASDAKEFLTVATIGTNPNTVTTTYATPATGNVTGPASSTDNALVRWDSTSGQLVKNSVAILSDAGALSALTQLDVDNIRVDGNVISSTNANGNISLTPNGSGKNVLANAQVTSINASQVVVTDASKNLISSIMPASALLTLVDQDGSPLYADDTGALNAYAMNLYAAPAYVTGMVLNFKAATTNTITNPTLAVNALAATVIVKRGGSALAAGDIITGQMVTVIYDGTNFQMQSQVANASAAANAWVDQTTTPVSIVASSKYSANNAGLVTLNMPATAAFGDEFQVQGQGAGGWLLRMNTGQVANLGSSPTTSAGSLASTNRYDAVKLVCTVANTTFNVVSAVGNLTIA